MTPADDEETADLSVDDDVMIARATHAPYTAAENGVFLVACIAGYVGCFKVLMYLQDRFMPIISKTCAKRRVTMLPNKIGQYRINNTIVMCRFYGDGHGLVLPGNTYSFYVCADGMCYTPEYAAEFTQRLWEQIAWIAGLAIAGTCAFYLIPLVAEMTRCKMRTIRYRHWYRRVTERCSLLAYLFPPLPLCEAQPLPQAYQAL